MQLKGAIDMQLSDTVKISAQAMARQVGEETVILDLASGNYLGLNPVGARIWELIGQGKTLGTVLGAVVSEYEVSQEQAERDLLSLVEQLQTQGLVSTG